MSSPARVWTVERGGACYGPATWDEVAAWARAGQVTPSDVLRRADDSTAYPAASFYGLVPSTDPAPTSTGIPGSVVLALALGLVATLGAVLAVRAIVDLDEASPPLVTIQADVPPPAAPPAATRADPEPTPAPDDALTASTVAALGGSWSGTYAIEHVDGDPYGIGVGERRYLNFDAQPVPSGLELFGWAWVPPSPNDHARFSGALMTVSGTSVDFAVGRAWGPADGQSVFLQYTGAFDEASGTISGTFTGARLDTAVTFDGTWLMRRG